MNPKEKAKQLIEKFEPLVDYQNDDCLTEREKILKNAKQCALIAVDLAIEYSDFHLDFLYNIKTELE